MTVLGPIQDDLGLVLMNENLICDSSFKQQYRRVVRENNSTTCTIPTMNATTSTYMKSFGLKQPMDDTNNNDDDDYGSTSTSTSTSTTITMDQLSRIKSAPFQHYENMTLSSMNEAMNDLEHLVRKDGRGKSLRTIILDVTSVEDGRDPKAAATIARRLGIHVIIGTSCCHPLYYRNNDNSSHDVDAAIPNRPDIDQSEQDIARMEKELLYGIELNVGSGSNVTNNSNNHNPNPPIRAGFIGQISISNKFLPEELRQLQACAVLQRTTNAPLIVSEDQPTQHVLEILDHVENCGANLQRVVVAHMDMYASAAATSSTTPSSPYAYLQKVLNRGITIGFDRYSVSNACFDPDQIFPTIKNVVDCIVSLLQINPKYVHQIVLSSGIFMKLQYTKYGGMGYNVFEDYLLQRLSNNVTKEQIHSMVRANPQQLLQWWTEPPKPKPQIEYIPCDICNEMFEPILGQYYTKYSFTYCGMNCLRKHRKAGFSNPPNNLK